MSLSVAIVGIGNVGSHLAKKLNDSDTISLRYIVSRDLNKAQQLISNLSIKNCEAVEIKNIHDLSCDLIILSVPDRNIAEVINGLSFPEHVVIVHTSGSQPIDLLSNLESYGVLYPFQTFTKNQEVNFDAIPVFVEGNSDKVTEIIETAAKAISPKVKRVSSEDRKKVHLAAVFACNFTNHLYAIAENILSDAKLDLSDIEHLMQETVTKAVNISAKNAQTGPAVRGDQNILDKHLEILKNDEDKYQVYKLLSEQIASLNKK